MIGSETLRHLKSLLQTPPLHFKLWILHYRKNQSIQKSIETSDEDVIEFKAKQFAQQRNNPTLIDFYCGRPLPRDIPDYCHKPNIHKYKKFTTNSNRFHQNHIITPYGRIYKRKKYISKQFHCSRQQDLLIQQLGRHPLVPIINIPKKPLIMSLRRILAFHWGVFASSKEKLKTVRLLI